MTHDPDAYDRQRDDADTERTTVTAKDWRDYLDAICGASGEPRYDLDPEGVMWG